MKDESLINMLAKFAWGIRVEPGHPYKHPPNGRRLQINHVWLADESAATTQDTLVYCTIGDRDPVLICGLKSSDPVQTSWNFQETEQVIFSVLGPGGVCLVGSYIEDLVRECQISAKATCEDNKSQSPGVLNGNAADKENLNYPLKTPECLITSKDDMKKKSNGYGGRRVFRIQNFVLTGGEKKRNGRRRLRKKYMSIADADIDREKKRNGRKRLRKKDMSIDDADIDGEKKRNGRRRVLLSLSEWVMRSIERRREIVGPQLIKKDSLNESIDMSGADNKLQALEIQTNKETEAEFGAVSDVP